MIERILIGQILIEPMSHWWNCGQHYGLRLRKRSCAAIGVVLLSLNASSAAQAGASEYQVKAAYLYNFAKLTKWPESTFLSGAAPLVIAVVGGDDEFVSAAKKTIEGRTIEGRPVTVKRLHTDDDLSSCQLAFIRASVGQKRTQTLISAVGNASILLVGESDGFLSDGGNSGRRSCSSWVILRGSYSVDHTPSLATHL